MKQKRGGSMQSLIRQANQMQTKMKELQEELSKKEYEGTSGGGAVTAIVQGESTLLSLKIDPEVYKENDPEMLQEMIVSAVNHALKVAKEDNEAEMKKITGPMNVPGLF